MRLSRWSYNLIFLFWMLLIFREILFRFNNCSLLFFLIIFFLFTNRLLFFFNKRNNDLSIIFFMIFFVKFVRCLLLCLSFFFCFNSRRFSSCFNTNFGRDSYWFLLTRSWDRFSFIVDSCCFMLIFMICMLLGAFLAILNVLFFLMNKTLISVKWFSFSTNSCSVWSIYFNILNILVFMSGIGFFI